MQRVFASLKEGEAILSKEDIHHLRDVVRIRLGEEVEVVSEEGVYLCRASSLDPFRIEEIAKINEKRETENPLTIAWSLLKGENNDWIVMKGTEIGATSFLPFLSKRTIVKASAGEEDNRLLRLKRIAKESAQQCRRKMIPEVQPYRDFLSILKDSYDIKLFAYEGLSGQGMSIPEALSSHKKGESVLLLIGPEGGFTPEEAKFAEENGFLSVSLGRRILRAETAAIYGASLISSWSESL